MREIKFRVWSNPNKRYVQDEDDYYVRSDGQFVEISLGDMFNELNTDRFIFEQYTGLKDKNGKEIFEGDICRYYNPEDKDGICEIKEDYALWISGTIKETNLLTPLFYLKCSSEWKVIGNIHENPELLNEK